MPKQRAKSSALLMSKHESNSCGLDAVVGRSCMRYCLTVQASTFIFSLCSVLIHLLVISLNIFSNTCNMNKVVHSCILYSTHVAWRIKKLKYYNQTTVEGPVEGFTLRHVLSVQRKHVRQSEFFDSCQIIKAAVGDFEQICSSA